MSDTIMVLYFFTVSIPAMAGLTAAYALAISSTRPQAIASAVLLAASSATFALVLHSAQTISLN